MFGSGDLGDKLTSFYSGNFKIFKNVLGKFISNYPPKHVITSTNFPSLRPCLSFSTLQIRQGTQ